jgi:hypothetical protein
VGYTSVTEMELYAISVCVTNTTGPDGRLLAEPGAGVAETHDWQRERERYRLRLGFRGTLLDDWFFGLRVETSNNARSAMSRLATTRRVARPVAADHSKKQRHVYVGQAYGGYRVSRYVHCRQNAEPAPQYAHGVGPRHQSRGIG